MNLPRHDFAKPSKLPGELEQRLKNWLKAAAALADKHWTGVFPFQARASFTGLDTARPAEALAHLPEPAFSYRVLLEPDTLTLLALPRAVVVALTGGLLGDAASALASDRELTSVEESLAEYFFEELLLPPLCDAWPEQTALGLRLEQREVHPRWTRIFADCKSLVVCQFTLAGPFGEHAFQWLIPSATLPAVLDGAAKQGGAAPLALASEPPTVEALVQELPVEISVLLGSADLSLAQVARLGVGDMVVLGQRISEPLTAAVGGELKLRGWPGRVGSSLAFQIESLTDCG